MTQQAIHFVDPTIPGISGRDLIERAIKTMQAWRIGAEKPDRAGADRTMRRDLSRLDRNMLRDLGLDRDAC